MNDIVSPENLVYKKPKLMNDTLMHYCAGCSHGVVHKLVAEVIEEMGMENKAVGVCPVGCAVFAYRYLDIDWQVVRRHLLQPSSAYGPTGLSLHTRVMAILPASVHAKPYMRSTVVRISL